jgi:hypothetical protein
MECRRSCLPVQLKTSAFADQRPVRGIVSFGVRPDADDGKAGEVMGGGEQVEVGVYLLAFS